MSEKFSVKGIFLDLDGTIVDSTMAYLQAAETAFAAINYIPPAGFDALDIPRRLEQGISISSFVNGETKKFLPIYLKAYYLVTKTKTKPLPETTATLQALSTKAKLAIVTMRHVPKHSIIEELQLFGLNQYFSSVITALDTTKPKPSPEALTKSAQKLGLNISDCMIVGDSVNDIRAGKAAGAKTVVLLSGLFSHEQLTIEKPDLILPNLRALPEFLI